MEVFKLITYYKNLKFNNSKHLVGTQCILLVFISTSLLKLQHLVSFNKVYNISKIFKNYSKLINYTYVKYINTYTQILRVY